MAALEDALSKLSEVTKQLNEESDAVNEIIASVEQAINRMAPGIEFWLDEHGLASSWAMESSPIVITPDPRESLMNMALQNAAENQKANQRIIDAATNRRVKGMGGTPVGSTPKTPALVFGPPMRTGAQAWSLGYGRYGEKWRILTRLVVYEKDGKQETIRQRSDARPLSDALRLVRVAAAPKLELLVESLAQAVKERLAGLRKAKVK